MTTTAQVKHVFPGANTPRGFYSLYDHIAPVDANKVFVIKGGPGVGKSTFMRKLAEDLEACGFAVEYHHCSADNNSLDGIYLPAIEVALIDGTAPHVVDPKHPGAVDEIIHLGDYWDEAAMRAPAHKAAILRTSRECSFRFKRAYDALRAAQAYLEEWQSYGAACLDAGALHARTEELAAELPGRRRPGAGKARRLFASAITYDGPQHWLGSLFSGAARRYVVTGAPGTGKSALIGRLVDTALARGYDADVYHCPMFPDRVDHAFLPALGVALIKSAWPHEVQAEPQDVVIDTGAFLDQERYAAYDEDCAAARAGLMAAVDRLVYQLGMAKKVHDELEEYYVPHMNFAAIEERRQRTLQRILALAAERQPASAD